MPLDPAKTEQRHERSYNDGNREKDRRADLVAGGVDDCHADWQPWERVRDPVEFPAYRARPSILSSPQLNQMAVDIFHHQHRTIHDQPEIDRAHG